MLVRTRTPKLLLFLNFKFIVMFLTASQFLSHLSGITVKLQSTTIDLINAHQQINEIYKEIRKYNVNEFQKVYQQCERMAAAIDVQPSKPRNCARQRHRSNADADTMESW